MKNIIFIILICLPFSTFATSYVCGKAAEIRGEMPKEHISYLIEEDSDGFYGITVSLSPEISGQPLESVIALVSSRDESDAEYIFPIQLTDNSDQKMFVLYVKKELLGSVYIKLSYVKRMANCVEGASVFSAKIT